MIDWTAARVLWDVLITLVALSAGAVTFWLRASMRALHQEEARSMEVRLARLEARVEHLPTHRDLTDLRASVSEVVESVATIAGRAETMTQMLKTIQEHLLETGR